MLMGHPGVHFNFPLLVGHSGEALTQVEIWCECPAVEPTEVR
jgi:hypothetical protein